MKLVMSALIGLLVGAGSVSAEVREFTPAEKAMIAAVVTADLKDPDSAQFQWPAIDFGQHVFYSYCGKVNAKNSFGGYTGYKTFQARLFYNNGHLEKVWNTPLPKEMQDGLEQAPGCPSL
jgi:hypothetical protein